MLILFRHCKIYVTYRGAAHILSLYNLKKLQRCLLYEIPRLPLAMIAVRINGRSTCGKMPALALMQRLGVLLRMYNVPELRIASCIQYMLRVIFSGRNYKSTE